MKSEQSAPQDAEQSLRIQACELQEQKNQSASLGAAESSAELRASRRRALTRTVRRQMQLSVRQDLSIVRGELAAVGDLSQPQNKWLALASLRAAAQYWDAAPAMALIIEAGGAQWLDEKEKLALVFRWGARLDGGDEASDGAAVSRKIDEGVASAKILRESGCFTAAEAAVFLDGFLARPAPSLKEASVQKRSVSACALACEFFSSAQSGAPQPDWENWGSWFARLPDDIDPTFSIVKGRAKAAQEAWELSQEAWGAAIGAKGLSGANGASRASGEATKPLPSRTSRASKRI